MRLSDKKMCSSGDNKIDQKSKQMSKLKLTFEAWTSDCFQSAYCLAMSLELSQTEPAVNNITL